jgi:hypothetical protein
MKRLMDRERRVRSVPGRQSQAWATSSATKKSFCEPTRHSYLDIRPQTKVAHESNSVGLEQ